jgi:hypothetical protein
VHNITRGIKTDNLGKMDKVSLPYRETVRLSLTPYEYMIKNEAIVLKSDGSDDVYLTESAAILGGTITDIDEEDEKGVCETIYKSLDEMVNTWIQVMDPMTYVVR